MRPDCERGSEKTVIDASAETTKVPDAELRSWVWASGKEPREIIIEAAVPARKVAFDARVGSWPTPKELREEHNGVTRSEILTALKSYLRALLGVEPTLLAAAGALAVEATGEQVRRLLEHPFVKAVRPNRKLRPPRGRVAQR